MVWCYSTIKFFVVFHTVRSAPPTFCLDHFYIYFGRQGGRQFATETRLFRNIMGKAWRLESIPQDQSVAGI